MGGLGSGTRAPSSLWMRSRIPLMKRLDSWVLNFLATSRASLIATFGGHAGPSTAARRCPAAGCCGRRPPCARAPSSPRTADDQLVDLGLVHLGAAHERLARTRAPRGSTGCRARTRRDAARDPPRPARRAGRAAGGRPRGPCGGVPISASRGLAARPARGARGIPRRARSHAAISSAASAASSPRLPTAPPARSHACSSVSAVITPKVIGTPVSSAARRDAVGRRAAT